MSEPDFDIELLEEETEGESTLQLPVNFLALGQVETDDVKVYIHQKVYKALEKLAASDPSKELGSILIGDYTQALGSLCVVITDCIEAKYTDASAATLTFTHETWDYVHAQHEKRFPDKKIIGWQHTHPSYGIFLSNYDLFIQDNFFNLPFQIAYVIDPVQHLRGFFQWKNGKTVKLHGYYVYDEPGKEIRLEKPKKEAKPKKKGAFPVIVSAILAVACLVLGIYCGVLHSRITELQARSGNLLAPIVNERDQLKKQVYLHEQTIAQLKQQLKALERQPEETKPETPEDGTVTVQFVRYTVQPGDSLTGICARLGIDYAKQKALILAINSIENPNHIYPGQELLLPK